MTWKNMVLTDTTSNKITRLLIIILLSSLWISVSGQPYISTHVKNRHVSENTFRFAMPDTTTPPAFRQVKDKLPRPYWPARPDVIKCYNKTWETAFSNLMKVEKKNGFIAPYIDPAFNRHIFMWDCSFMCMFGKYASRAFNFQGTLDNFYAKQHPDGFICREIRESDGTDCFERFDPSSTGPDIMPWAEWDYFEVFNDSARLKRVFPVLLGYHEWYKTYRSWPDGTYFSSGWGCGMDNQPRVPQGFDPRWSHAHMSWIDITLQQVYSGSILVKMARSLNRSDDVTMIETETLRLTDHLNRYMWDSQENFYFDRYNDGTLSGVKSIASFWALLAGVIPDTSAGRFIKHLEDKSEFDRLHRVPSLSADNPDYDPSGGYWKGAVWAPTNYMVLKGLTRYGYDSLAHAIALNHLNNVVEVFNLTNDIRENYSPDMVQGNNGRNFVGWTGLVPVNVLLEHVFGLRPDVPGNTLTVDVRLTDEYGITRYPFGRTGCLAIHCRKRKSISVKPRVSVETNVPLKIIIKWNDGALVRTIGPGTHHLH